LTITVAEVKTNLTSTDYGLRLRGVNQLRQLEPALAFELLQTAVADSNARVRYAAVSQMSSLGQQDRQLSLEILLNCVRNDSELDVKAVAADALGGLGLAEAYDDLLALYQEHSDWVLRLSVLAALGELGEPRAFDLLIEALNAPEELLKMAAIGSLGDLGDARAVSALAPFASHADWQVRQRVAQALYRIGGEAAQPLLATLAQDSMQQVSAAATGAGLELA
jgi:HEAT repeat protein